jgi:hypothetical protein
MAGFIAQWFKSLFFEAGVRLTPIAKYQLNDGHLSLLLCGLSLPQKGFLNCNDFFHKQKSRRR